MPSRQTLSSCPVRTHVHVATHPPHVARGWPDVFLLARIAAPLGRGDRGRRLGARGLVGGHVAQALVRGDLGPVLGTALAAGRSPVRHRRVAAVRIGHHRRREVLLLHAGDHLQHHVGVLSVLWEFVDGVREAAAGAVLAAAAGGKAAELGLEEARGGAELPLVVRKGAARLVAIAGLQEDLHMLVLFKSGFSRISVRLCANAQREPLPHLFDKKNLHISVFISCRTCFSRSEALGNSSDAIADRGRWGQQVSTEKTGQAMNRGSANALPRAAGSLTTG
eukprot:CAMPEP_0115346376 /NCGR_PEP_ID=MMETSP0270-20121206/94309_1 /TAXON_ID=71861 /ORGANISM="Scrippsiella trochoidea, Strain CCMP3099" /LENGTH=278 /DNA_ID=CAMNT_0002768217 /DNA_START=364 /DNA_END=1198 /DNA_ORIENTATION=+